MLRDKFEEAMTAEPDYSENSIPENLIYDVEVTEKIRQGKGGVIIR